MIWLLKGLLSWWEQWKTLKSKVHKWWSKKVVEKWKEEWVEALKSTIADKYTLELLEAVWEIFNPKNALDRELNNWRRWIAIKTKKDIIWMIRDNGITVDMKTSSTWVSEWVIVTYKRDENGREITWTDWWPQINKCIYFVWLVNTDNVHYPENTIVFIYPFYEYNEFSVRTIDGRIIHCMEQWEKDFDWHKKLEFIYSDNAKVIEQLKNFTSLNKRVYSFFLINPSTWKKEEHYFIMARKNITFRDDNSKEVTHSKTILIDLSLVAPILVADTIDLSTVEKDWIVKFQKSSKPNQQSLTVMVSESMKYPFWEWNELLWPR